MPWRKSPMILSSITGKRDIGFSGEDDDEKDPTSKIQVPEKIQAPKSEAEAAAFEHVGSWILDLLWILDLGCWILSSGCRMFHPCVPPRPAGAYHFAFSRGLANQLNPAGQPLPAHC